MDWMLSPQLFLVHTHMHIYKGVVNAIPKIMKDMTKMKQQWHESESKKKNTMSGQDGFGSLASWGVHPFADVSFHIQFSMARFTLKKLSWNLFMWDVCAFNFNHIFPTILHIFLGENILGWYH